MASPNVFANPFSSLGPTLASYLGNYFSGNVRWVSSTHTAASDANTGLERELPKATWTSAYSASSAGDVIVCEASHAETISVANVLGTADVLTVGLGSGSSKPRFTSAVAGVMWTLNTNLLGFCNLYFPASTAATTIRISCNGAVGRVWNCDFECGANDTTSTIQVTGNNVWLESLTFLATASRPARAIRVTGAVTDLAVKDVLLDGSSYGWANPALSVEAAVTRAHLENVRLANYSDVVFTTTGATYKLFGVRPIDNTGSRITIAA